MTEAIFEETRLLDGRVICFQPASGYRSAIDPILLQAAVPAGDGDRVLDLGCGVGSAALCLAARVPGAWVIGLDQLAPLVDAANQSATASRLADRVAFHLGDLLAPPAMVAAGGFDHVMANPPFRKAGTSRPSPDAVKAAATVEGNATLADWVKAAADLAAPDGTVTVIHHGDRAEELRTFMAARLGGLAILPIAAKRGDGRPGRILIQGRLGAPAGERRLPPLVLHESGGAYTETADAILRGRAAIDMAGGGAT